MKSDIIFQCAFDYARNKTRRKFLILYGRKSEIIRGIYQAKPHCIFQTECGYVYLASQYYIDIKEKRRVQFLIVAPSHSRFRVALFLLPSYDLYINLRSIDEFREIRLF